jgi:DNA invertase Pin-like site-specific DNA recombinase
MPTYGYIRTSRHLQEGPLGMAPASQELQLRRAGVPLENIFHDVGVSGSTGTQQRQGWHQLNDRLAGGDTLAVVAIDRIGRTWQDTVRSICDLRDRGVNIRSLAESEAQWTRYLEADEGSPEAFFGQVLTMFAAWVADQELESIKRRTRDGLERAASRERPWGLRVRSAPGSWRRCGGCGKEGPASGGSPATSSAHPAPCCGCCGEREWRDEDWSMAETERYVELAGGYHDWVKRL